MEDLLSKGANPNQEGGLFYFPLLAASHQGHAGVIKSLLHHGASIEVSHDILGNALLLAASNGHEKAVRLLVEAGLE